eukprot:1089829-Rhodomonas_salina.3
MNNTKTGSVRNWWTPWVKVFVPYSYKPNSSQNSGEQLPCTTLMFTTIYCTPALAEKSHTKFTWANRQMSCGFDCGDADAPYSEAGIWSSTVSWHSAANKVSS